MPKDFVKRFGPWALVTGASSGIGEALVRDLASHGLNLVITARREKMLDSLAESLRSAHRVDVEVVAADLSRTDFLEPIVRACEGKDVGLVVSNAGFGLKGEHHTFDLQRVTEMLLVNCHAPLLLAHAFAPRLIARGRGGLLFTGSIEGFHGFPWSSEYAATKAFVMVFGEGLWGELNQRGIDVMVLAPGATDTDAPTLQGVDKSRIPGRVMAPSEVAKMALAHLGKTLVFVPGWQNRLLVSILSSLPRRLTLRMAGGGMRRTLVAQKSK